MKWLLLGISLKITISLCKMKFKVTTGVKHIAHYTHCSMFVLTWRIALQSQRLLGTRSTHHFVPIFCNKIAHKLTRKDREFLQFDFDKILTKEIDIKNLKCFLYVSYIHDTIWWIGRVTKVNVHEGDLKIEFLHPHGPRKTFSWPSVADKCQRSNKNQMYWIWDTDLESIWKP